MSSIEELVNQSGLTDVQLSKLQSQSLGFWKYQAFILFWGIDSHRSSNPYTGIGLGLSEDLAYNTPYSVACDLLNLRHCRSFPQDLCISYSELASERDKIENQMRIVMRVDEPIVFFVPPNIFEHENAGHTMEEMRFLLRSGDKYPAKTHFVFGIYEPLAYSYLILLGMTH